MSYDDEIIKFLNKNFSDVKVKDNESAIDFLSDTFKFTGSKIDLSQEYNFILIENINRNYKNIIENINKSKHIINKIKSTSQIHYVGDNLSGIEIIFCNKFFSCILSFLIENIPEHHYFFSKDKKWCLFIATEGYIEYGEINREIFWD